MAVNDTPVARFDFRSGDERGGGLVLYNEALVFRGASRLETVPLQAIAAVRVAFERDPKKIGWCLALLVIALILYAVSTPLAGLAGGAAAEVAGSLKSSPGSPGVGVSAALNAVFRALEAIANLLPAAGLLLALAGVGLGAFGWVGRTILTLSIGSGERRFAVLGRDPTLLDFSELLSTQLIQRKR